MGDESPWATCPLRATATISSSPTRREGRGEGVGSGERPLLEASRGSWKKGRARSQGGYKGTRSGRGSVWVGGGLGLGQSLGQWRSGSWSESGEFVEPAASGERVWVVRWSLQSVEVWASRRRRGLEAQLCQLCRENLRVHVGRAGESLPAAWQGPSSTAATLAAVGMGRRGSHHGAPRGCR